MSYARKICLSMVALAMPAVLLPVGGCEKAETPPPAKPAAPAGGSTTPPTTKPAMPTTGPSIGSLPGLPSSLPTLNTPSLPSDLPKLPDVTPPTLPALPALPSGATEKPAIPAIPTTPDAAAGAAGDTSTQATKLLADVTTYIKENKFELADKALVQLEGMKGSLPASYAPQIDAAKQALTAAKAGGGIKLPDGIPGLGK